MKAALGVFLCLAPLIAGSASAVMLAPSGQGQVLIYPYYSTAEGAQTLLSVVNHDSKGKAVKVHIRESRNGRSVASFNLYLAEFDVWTAALFTDAEGRPALLTTDRSCTVPNIVASTELPQLPSGQRYLPFSTAGFTGANADGGPTTPDRAARGVIELIEMGALVDNSDSDAFATHVNGVPFGCQQLEAAWQTAGYWTRDPQQDLLPPSGTLSGSASVLQIADGSVYGVDATALDHFSVVAQHTGPNASTPDLSSAVTDPARQTVRSTVIMGGETYRSLWPASRAIDAVSSVLAQAQIRAEYSAETAIAARTDWVISLPTKRFYTDPAIVDAARAPFTVRFGTGGEPYEVTTYDRETRRPLGTLVGVLPPDFHPCLRNVTQVIPFNRPLAEIDQDPGCKSAPISLSVTGQPFQSGFTAIQLSGNGHRLRPALGGESWEGLPVIGFTMQRYRNTAARPGEIGIYSSARPHQGTAACTAVAAACTPL